jgi:hypothetical protein
LLIYGHSMGAYLALRVTRMLEEAGHPPAYLIVSGNPGPGVPRKRPGKRYLLGKAAFIEELRTLGGVRKRCSRTRICLGFSSPSCGRLPDCRSRGAGARAARSRPALRIDGQRGRKRGPDCQLGPLYPFALPL